MDAGGGLQRQLDLIGEANGQALAKFTRNLNQDSIVNAGDPAGVWVGSSLGRKAGEKIPLMMNDHTREYTIRGVFDDHAQGGSAIVMDIAGAEQELGREGRVDRVLLKVPDDRPLEQWEAALRAALPAGLEEIGRASCRERVCLYV